MARDFSGTNQYITMPTVSFSGDCSLACIINADTFNFTPNASTVTGIFGKMQWGGNADGDFHVIGFDVAGTGNFRLSTIDSAGQTNADYVIEGVLNTGQDYRLAAVHDESGGTSKLYVDGTEQASASPSGTLADSGNSLAIGAFANNLANTEFNGRISECAAWDRMLTAGERSALASGASPLLFPESLVLYMPLVGRYTTELDVIRGLNGTVTGATAAVHPRVFYPSRPHSAIAVAAPYAPNLIFGDHPSADPPRVDSGGAAPVHSATEGTLYWDTGGNTLYVNNDGATGWTAIN